MIIFSISDMKDFFKIFILFTLIISCGSDGNDGDNGGGDPLPTPPENPTLVSPSDNTVCETGVSISETQSNVTFVWQSSQATTSYNLEIKNLNTNSIQNIQGITTTTSTVVLEKGLPYSWKVISRNNESTQTGESPTWKFYLAGLGSKNYAPFPAELKSPKSGSTIARNSEGKVTFEWDGSDPDQGDQLTFTLYVDKVDGKQTPSSDFTDLNVKTTDAVLDGGSTYYWRVKSSDGTNSSFSNIYSFKTE